MHHIVCLEIYFSDTEANVEMTVGLKICSSDNVANEEMPETVC